MSQEQIFSEIKLLKPEVFKDKRGFFFESFNKKRYQKTSGNIDFVQDNISFSSYGTLRGLHLQNPRGQGKLIQVLQGEVYDVAVDVRKDSPSFGKFQSFYLSEANKQQVFIPPGFAHGFLVTSPKALFFYKCTDYYYPEDELSILWDDQDINIPWPIKDPQLSTKDQIGLKLKEALKLNKLPLYKDSK